MLSGKVDGRSEFPPQEFITAAFTKRFTALRAQKQAA